MDTAEARIGLTGNPFVDTGLAVIAVLGKLDDLQDLNLTVIRRVHAEYGSLLAGWNAKLKSYSQVFGTNNPLFQTGYGYKKGIGPGTLNLAIYQATLQGFLDAMELPPMGRRCEACGTPTAFNFGQVCRDAVKAGRREVSEGPSMDQRAPSAAIQPRAEDLKIPDEKRIGRDWFPLSGSLGSDAQALPSASRSVHLCPKCLFAMHYLPLAVILVDGQLAVFQSTSDGFQYELVRDIVTEVQGRIAAGNRETIGAKEGTRALMRRLLTLFQRLQTAGRLQRVRPGTVLQIWNFTNAGASPKCSVEGIPSPAFVFLSNAVGQGLRAELERLVDREGKGQRPLFRCITEGRDYTGLYPRGKTSGVSPKLFRLYQVEVRGRSPRALAVASMLAKEVARQSTPSELKRLQREEAFREPSGRQRLRSLMVQSAHEGNLDLHGYLALFPYTEAESGLSVCSDGWDLIRYYLHSRGHTELGGDGDLISQAQLHPKLARLQYYAGVVCDHHIKHDGVGRFRSETLRWARRGQMNVLWLRRQFALLAETHPGFTHGAWVALCANDAGQTSVSELLFQMRLLWLQWLREGHVPVADSPVVGEDSGLPDGVADGLRGVVEQYVERRGLVRFQRDVLTRLRRSEIGLDWFRRCLVGQDDPSTSELPTLRTEEEWESFLLDEEGRSCAGERLFQMHLLVANLYRQARYER